MDESNMVTVEHSSDRPLIVNISTDGGNININFPAGTDGIKISVGPIEGGISIIIKVSNG